MQLLNYEAITADYRAAPEGDKPRWCDMARTHGGEVTDAADHKRISDRIRRYITQGRGDQQPTAKANQPTPSRADRLGAEHPYLKTKCDEHGVPIENTRLYWSKVDGASVLTVIPDEGEGAQETFLDAVRDIVAAGPVRPYAPVKISRVEPESLALIVSDMHVGLNPNPNRRAMYPVEYNETIFRENLTKVYEAARHNVEFYGPVELLTLNDLGDGLDGYNNQTTRGGHHLEQNMDNVAQFRVFVTEKLRLIENLIDSGFASRYVVNNVSNDNHAGSFAAIANTTLQLLIEQRYPKELIQFRVMHQFMEHFSYGDHTFILTHGKDQEYQFKGLPLNLDFRTEKFVRGYIDHHGIKAKYIHLYKGDLHQNAYSKCRAFDYRNFMSFAPANQWAVHNFEGSYSGFAIQRIAKHAARIAHTDYDLRFERIAQPQPEYVY